MKAQGALRGGEAVAPGPQHPGSQHRGRARLPPSAAQWQSLDRASEADTDPGGEGTCLGSHGLGPGEPHPTHEGLPHTAPPSGSPTHVPNN